MRLEVAIDNFTGIRALRRRRADSVLRVSPSETAGIGRRRTGEV